MKILYLSNPIDPAGVSVNMALAIKKHTKHDCKYAIEQTTHVVDLDLLRSNEIEPIFIDKPGTEKALEAAIEWSDVVHVNSAMARWPLLLHNTIDLEELLVGKGILFHTHGGAWLLNPDWVCERCDALGALMVTCSPIDEIVAPGIRWVPNVLPEHIKPSPRKWDGRLICGQACGDALYKGGGIVEYVFEWLNRTVRGIQVDYELVMDVPYHESLAIRAKHHMTIDNWTQGFHGMAALEGMALGQVAFSRFHPMAREKWEAFSDDMIPIIDIAGMDDFGRWMRVYDRDREALKEQAEKSRKWIENNYTEKQVIAHWIDVYKEAIAQSVKRQAKPAPKEVLRAMPAPVLSQIMKSMNIPLTPNPNDRAVGYFMNGMEIEDAARLIAKTDDDAYVICKVSDSDSPHVYDLLTRTDRRLHRYFQNIMSDGSTLISLEPKC